MTVLRSREVVGKQTTSSVEIQPLTPAKEEEVNKSSSTTPGNVVQTSQTLPTSSISNSIGGLRRSARLSSKHKQTNSSSSSSSSYNVNVASSTRRSRKRKQSGGGGKTNSIPPLVFDLEEQYDVDDDLRLPSGKKMLLKPLLNNNNENLSETTTTESEVEVAVVVGIDPKTNGSWKRRFTRQDKNKGPLLLEEESPLENITAAQGLEEIRSNTTLAAQKEEMDIDAIERDTLHILEKGKEKHVLEVGSSSNCTNVVVDSTTSPRVDDNTVTEAAVNLDHPPIPIPIPIPTSTNARRDHMERFRNIARRNASRFAYFSPQQEQEDEDEVELQLPSTDDVVEDWPGPFSTAMKIIKDRMPAQQHNIDKIHSVPLVWLPKEKHPPKKLPPSLQELCMTIIAENADAIASLENVPDVLRHKLTHLLCDSRKMNSHFFDLLATGSPSEIRVKDCSWLSEEQFTNTFQRTDTSNLTVLQLDQCGRCLPDYVLLTTLAHLPSKLSALTNISLKGACRLSDAGLSALVASAPALRSINLGCCSLLTSDGIIDLADKLGPILKELYIDECFGIDALRILPALLKLESLEVLSISHFETVNDSFIRQFVAVRGEKMKELVLADCTKLTDKSLKAIAESCPGLCAIDLTNLSKLTDAAIGHLANGCQTIQTMKFCRNAFSDEAVAAYVEARGEPLKELSLNHVDEVGHHTALSLAKHAINLLSLDLSWCRNMTNEALGLIVDSCASLKMVKLFGCTQITNVFIDGHSNEEVRITGLKESQILKNIQVHDLSFPLRYSSL